MWKEERKGGKRIRKTKKKKKCVWASHRLLVIHTYNGCWLFVTSSDGLDVFSVIYPSLSFTGRRKREKKERESDDNKECMHAMLMQNRKIVNGDHLFALLSALSCHRSFPPHPDCLLLTHAARTAADWNGDGVETRHSPGGERERESSMFKQGTKIREKRRFLFTSSKLFFLVAATHQATTSAVHVCVCVCVCVRASCCSTGRFSSSFFLSLSFG